MFLRVWDFSEIKNGALFQKILMAGRRDTWETVVKLAKWVSLCILLTGEGSDLELEYLKIPFITGSDLELLASFPRYILDYDYYSISR